MEDATRKDPTDVRPTTDRATRAPRARGLVPGGTLMATLLAATLGLVQAGCHGDRPGTDETAGQAPARQAEATKAQPAVGTVQAYLMDGGLESEDGAGARGSFLGNFIVSVYNPEGIWVDLGRHAKMTVPLGSTEPSALVKGLEVPPGTYTKVRILVCHSSAEVTAGSRVAGATVAQPSHVHLTDTGDIFIIRDVEPFEVTATRPVGLDIDLNSSGWLTQESLRSGEASIPDFENQVKVRVRSSEPS